MAQSAARGQGVFADFFLGFRALLCGNLLSNLMQAPFCGAISGLLFVKAEKVFGVHVGFRTQGSVLQRSEAIFLAYLLCGAHLRAARLVEQAATVALLSRGYAAGQILFA